MTCGYCCRNGRKEGIHDGESMNGQSDMSTFSILHELINY